MSLLKEDIKREIYRIMDKHTGTDPEFVNEIELDEIVDYASYLLNKRPLTEDVNSIILLSNSRPMESREALSDYYQRLYREYDLLLTGFQIHKTIKPS